jgi:predicted enzyme related to lactoylglutathione lyase
MTAPGAIVWFELWVPDVERAKQFYGQLFGWTFRAMPEYDAQYWLIEGGSGLGGALLPGEAANNSDRAGTVVYVAVSDLAAAAERCLALGGRVEQDATEIGDGTSFILVRDPFGTRLGLWSDQTVIPRRAAG